MRITDILVHQPLGLVRIQTDAGIEGLCDGASEEAARVIPDTYGPVLIGRDPLDREWIWQRLHNFDRERYVTENRIRGLIDVALWDLAGKAAGVPVWQLIGGVRDRIPCYRSGHELPNVESYVNDALHHQAQGFKGYKDHCHNGPEFMMTVAREVRSAVGPDFHLMHDANAIYIYTEAIRVGRELERQDYTWFEEPLSDYDYHGLQRLAAELDIPILATEYLPGSIWSTAQVVTMQACDIIRASITWRGGITDVLKLARLAESFGMKIEITSGGVCWYFAHANCYGAIHNTTFCEHWERPLDPIVTNHLPVADGHMHMPTQPGLGFELDWDLVQARTERVVSAAAAAQAGS